MNISIKKRNVINVSISSIIFLFAWLIGRNNNINIVTLVTYVISLFLIYKRDRDFFLRYIYVIIANSLFILGVFFCDVEGIYLTEVSKTTGYTNCFNLALFACHIFLLFCLISYNLHPAKKEHENSVTSKYNCKYNAVVKCLCLAVVVIESIALLSVIVCLSKSLLKVDRFVINTQYLSNFTLKVKNNIILAIPLFYFLKDKNKKIYIALYILLYFLIMLLTGEKYGPYIRLLYLLILFSPAIFNYCKKHVHTLLPLFFVFIAMMVFVQYKSLYGFTYGNLTEYLQSRLCQQGQVWWSTYPIRDAADTGLSGFNYEIKSAYDNDLSTTYPYAGKWKMMNLATDGSELFRARVENKIPFSSTTTSSVYYYFGFVGIVLVYPLLGLLYGFLVKLLIERARTSLLASIIGVKLFIMFDYLYTASDLTSLISIKSIAYILLFVLLIMHSKRRRVYEKS